MPPHCDTLDGPVVRAARCAIETNNVNLVLPYVPKEGEEEVVRVFEQVLKARTASAASREVADRYFFETVVRVHRAGEGAPFTGLKPAGVDVGPVIPVAETAIETGSPRELIDLLSAVVHEEIDRRLHEVIHLRPHASATVDEARAWVHAMLGLQVWAHGLYAAARAEPHAAA